LKTFWFSLLLLIYSVSASANGLFFDGADLVDLDAAASTDIGVNFTVIAWIMTHPTEDTGDERTIFGNRTGTDGIQFRVEANERLGLVDQGQAGIATSDGTITNGIPICVAISHDNTGGGNTNFFFNGFWDGKNDSGTMSVGLNGIRIGYRGTTTSESFDGWIWDIRFYNTVLPHEIIKMLACNPVSQIATNAKITGTKNIYLDRYRENLRCHISFFNMIPDVSNTGTWIPDMSGNNHHGDVNDGGNGGNFGVRDSFLMGV